ncbi:MAG: monovalent cation/H+ antiporter subunit D family protein, partial [Steroidobacteraceae bacterium]
MTAGDWLPLLLIVPMLGAAGILAAGRVPNLREGVTVVTSLLLFWVVVQLAMSGAEPRWVLAEPLPGLQLALSPEPLGLLFALIASGLWIVTSVYAFGYMRAKHEANQTRFYAFFALSIGAAMGVAMAANLFTLFVFYEALTLSTYPLVAHHGDDKARAGARTYLRILLGTSIG